MKVTILAQYFPPDMGGAGTRAFNIAKGLNEIGVNVTVVAAFPHYPDGDVPKEYRRKALKIERMSGLRLIRVWVPSLPHNSVLNRLILHFCFVTSSLFALPFVDKMDVIWIANPNLFSFLPGVFYGFVNRAPLVRNVDDLWPEVFYELGLVRDRFVRKMLNLLAWFSYVVPSAITPISPAYKRKIMSKYGIREDKIRVIEVGTDEINPLKSRTAEKNRFVIMYSGILGVGYDFRILLKAAQDLAYIEDLFFIIRGRGELAPQLRRLIGGMQLHNVLLDTDFLSKSALNSLLDSADVFILPMDSRPATEDGLPTKIFEYQAHGKPLICVSCGESAKYVAKTKSGLIVKPGDLEGLKQAIQALYKNDKFCRELGLNGWVNTKEKMTAEKLGKRMQEVFLLAI